MIVRWVCDFHSFSFHKSKKCILIGLWNFIALNRNHMKYEACKSCLERKRKRGREGEKKKHSIHSQQFGFVAIGI